MMYANMKRPQTVEVEVQISLEGDTQQMHPRMAELHRRIENAVCYLEEHGSGGEHSSEELDFLCTVYKALQKCPEDHPIKVHWCEPIKTVLSKWRPDSVAQKEQA